MSLTTCENRYPLKSQRSYSQRQSRNNLDLHQEYFANNECEIFTRKNSRLSANSQREARKNNLREIIKIGYTRPPTTIVKPFNLSRPNSKYQQSNIEEPKQLSITHRSKSPISKKPFVVYKSNKPLTVPQEFNFLSR